MSSARLGDLLGSAGQPEGEKIFQFRKNILLLSYLAWRGDGRGWLAEPVGGGVVGPLTSLLAGELVGPVHRLRLDPRHDLLALELPHLLSQVPVGLLSVLVGVEGDVPGVVESVLAGDNLGAAGASEQILKYFQFQPKISTLVSDCLTHPDFLCRSDVRDLPEDDGAPRVVGSHLHPVRVHLRIFHLQIEKIFQ